MQATTKTVLRLALTKHGTSWFSAGDVSEVFGSVNHGGVASSLRALYGRGLVDRKVVQVQEGKYKRNTLTRRAYQYKVNKRGKAEAHGRNRTL